MISESFNQFPQTVGVIRCPADTESIYINIFLGNSDLDLFVQIKDRIPFFLDLFKLCFIFINSFLDLVGYFLNVEFNLFLCLFCGGCLVDLCQGAGYGFLSLLNEGKNQFAGSRNGLDASLLDLVLFIFQYHV